MATVQLTVVNLDALKKKWGMMSKALVTPTTDQKALLKRIAVVLLESVEKNFKAGGRPAGWTPLKEATLKARRHPNTARGRARRAAGFGPQILQDTGRLMLSLMGMPVSTGDKVYRTFQDGFEFGTRVEYAATHQFGSNKAIRIPAHERVMTKAFGRELKKPLTVKVRAYTLQQNIPARPFLIIQKDDGPKIVKLMADYLEDLDKRQRLKG